METVNFTGIVRHVSIALEAMDSLLTRQSLLSACATHLLLGPTSYPVF